MTSRNLFLVVLLGILTAGAAQADSLSQMFFGNQRPESIGPLMQPSSPEALARVRELPKPELIGAPVNGWLLVEKSPLTLRIAWRNANGQSVRQPIKGRLIVFVERANDVGVNFVDGGIYLAPRHLGLSSWVTAIFESQEDVQLSWSYSFLASWPMADRDFDRLMRSMRNTQTQSQHNINVAAPNNVTGTIPNETSIGITNDNVAASANQ